MHTVTVIVNCDIKVDFTGDQQPIYRLYVGDELFVERRWFWKDEFLQEQIVIQAPYGLYPIKYELLDHPNAKLKVQSFSVVSGPGRFRKKMNLEIHNENA